MADTHLGLIGYGEVGGIFGAGLQRSVRRVCAWDTRLTDAMRARAAQDLAKLPETHRRREAGAAYPLTVAPALEALAREADKRVLG